MKSVSESLSRFARDESGAVLSAELVIVLTVAVLSMVVGLSEVAGAVNSEMFDIARAFHCLNQSYATPSFFGCRPKGGYFLGSHYWDQYDGGFCQQMGLPHHRHHEYADVIPCPPGMNQGHLQPVPALPGLPCPCPNAAGDCPCLNNGPVLEAPQGGPMPTPAEALPAQPKVDNPAESKPAESKPAESKPMENRKRKESRPDRKPNS